MVAGAVLSERLSLRNYQFEFPMNAVSPAKRSPIVYVLILAAVGLLGAIYHSPLWWVSLTAPNYPEEAFPDGVRIHFHMNGVFNGCQKMEKAEIQEEEALDCVHEMDTINHYVGMYPIAAGGVVERAFSPFLVSMLGVMLIGFMLPNNKLRLGVMGLGFAAITGWMYLVYYGADGLQYHSEGYVEAMVTSLDQEAGEVEMDPGQALIAMMKASLAKSNALAEESKPAVKEGASDKANYLENLRVTFEKDRERRGSTEAWHGSGEQILGWHYDKSLGRYFNNRAEIEPMVATMSLAGNVVAWALPGAMLLLLWGARKESGLLYWMLILVPMALPVFFLIDYSAWLWWYGHSLNDMGAFTVKQFMPTVFGDGKVAQFATHSYPYIGFGLMMLTSLLLAVAALLRRKELVASRKSSE